MSVRPRHRSTAQGICRSFPFNGKFCRAHNCVLMKPSRVALGRWTATLWLALPLALLPCASTAGAPAMDAAPQQGGAVQITRAELLSVPGTGYSAPPRRIEDAGLPREGWQPVDLPRTAARELVPTPAGSVRTVTDWYRIDLSGLAPPARQPLLL